MHPQNTRIKLGLQAAWLVISLFWMGSSSNYEKSGTHARKVWAYRQLEGLNGTEAIINPSITLLGDELVLAARLHRRWPRVKSSEERSWSTISLGMFPLKDTVSKYPRWTTPV